MFGQLSDAQRTAWADTFTEGQEVQTRYQGAWRQGIVTGKGDNGLLKVTVLDEEGEVLFKDRLTTKDAIQAV